MSSGKRNKDSASCILLSRTSACFEWLLFDFIACFRTRSTFGITSIETRSLRVTTMSHIIKKTECHSTSTEPIFGYPEKDLTLGDAAQYHSPDTLNAHRTYLLKVAHDLLKPELRPKVSPSDLVQESIVIAIRKFQSFHGSSPQQLRDWLESILRRKYCNLQRVFYRNARHAIRREVSLDAVRSDQPGWEIPDPHEDDRSNDANLQIAMIRRELRHLTPAENEVFLLRMEQDLPVSEIAVRLGITEACVHKRYQRAIKHLYERLHKAVDSDMDLS